MSTKYMMKMRLAFLVLAIKGFAVAGLYWAIVRFAVILRDRAKSDIITPGKTIADNTFISLTNHVLEVAVVVALLHSALAIAEILLAVHARWLKEQDSARSYCGVYEVVLSVVTMIAGGYVTGSVRGFQTSFERFQNDDNVPYYNFMYYAGLGQVAGGGLVIACVLAWWVCSCGTRDTGATEETQ